MPEGSGLVPSEKHLPVKQQAHFRRILALAPLPAQVSAHCVTALPLAGALTLGLGPAIARTEKRLLFPHILGDRLRPTVRWREAPFALLRVH